MPESSGLLPVVFSLFLIGLLLYLAYLLSRALKKNAVGSFGSGNIKIIERAAVAPDKGLFIALVCGKHYLFGYSAGEMQLLLTLGDNDVAAREPGEKTALLSAFNLALKGAMNKKTAEKPDTYGLNHDETKV